MSLLGLNYIGGVHFSELLKKSLTENENELINDNNVNNENQKIDVEKNVESDLCLISQEPLTCYQIELDCGHKFNYDCIFNEMMRQNAGIYKYKKECPYCRTSINGVLPYCEGYKKVDRVNHPPSRIIKRYRKKKCGYILSSGKNKGNCCTRFAVFPKDLCKMHQKIYYKVTAGSDKIISENNNTNSAKSNKKYKWEISNERKQCKATIKSGKNANQRCKCSVNISAHPTDETKWYCGKHKKYIKI